MGDCAPQLLGDGFDLTLEQFVGIHDGDLISALHFAPIPVAGSAIADRPGIAAAQRVGVCTQMASLEVFDQLDGRCIASC
jgi:hypothetical protein